MHTSDSALSTLHLSIAFRTDSHGPTYRFYSLDTVYTVRTVSHGIPETRFGPIHSRSVSTYILFPCKGAECCVSTSSQSKTTLLTVCHAVGPPVQHVDVLTQFVSQAENLALTEMESYTLLPNCFDGSALQYSNSCVRAAPSSSPAAFDCNTAVRWLCDDHRSYYCLLHSHPLSLQFQFSALHLG